MDYNLQFDKLCEKIKIGKLTAEPVPLTGGHMHRVFCLETTVGKYVVKALNPNVMQRPEAMGNLINAENIARIAAKHVPAVPALIFDNTAMQELDGQYYYVFDWLDGKTLQTDELTVEHCTKMGEWLAVLHNTDFSPISLSDDYSFKESEFDWDYYIRRGIESHVSWIGLVKGNRDNLYNWNKRLIDSAVKLSSKTVISHGDLEPKNVMWCDKKPIIIDWEAAGFVAPSYDLLETAVYWAKDCSNNINKERFTAFIKAYKSKNPNLSIDYYAVFDKGFVRLGWLEYSMKRSLGIESADEAERQMGTEHVFWSINDLLHYEKMIPILKEWMSEVWDG